MNEKRGKEEGRRQKAIIGILLTAVMLASVLAATMPSLGGRPANDQIGTKDFAYGSEVTITDVKPADFYPGQTKEVVLKVRSTCGGARAVKLTFESTRNISVIGPAVAEIDTLNPWHEKKVKITVHVKEGTPVGIHSLPVICSWEEYSPFNFPVGYATKHRGPERLEINFNIIAEISISTDKKEYSPGDTIIATIHLSNPTGNAQNMLFKWYFGIPDNNSWSRLEQTTINMSANYDETFKISIPVEDQGNESFCGCYVISLTNATTQKVVSTGSTTWIYTPSA
ncbi:MAG: hypothetical protein N2V75_03090 [Methanophagales archaeon]|nr:hypothetical protein [Methanophagales archaeon]